MLSELLPHLNWMYKVKRRKRKQVKKRVRKLRRERRVAQQSMWRVSSLKMWA